MKEPPPGGPHHIATSRNMSTPRNIATLQRLADDRVYTGRECSFFWGLSTMSKTTELLDRAKLIHRLPSDYKLSLASGISFSSLSSYRHGKTLPDARAITKLCGLTGDDPGLLIAEIELERAKTDEARALWSDVAKRLAAAAAAGIVSASVMAGPTLPASPDGDGSVYYVKRGTFKQTVRLRRRAHTRKTPLAMSC